MLGFHLKSVRIEHPNYRELPNFRNLLSPIATLSYLRTSWENGGRSLRGEKGISGGDEKSIIGYHYFTIYEWNQYISFRLTKGRDKSTGPLAPPFSCTLAPLTHSLALHCWLCSRPLLRLFVCSRDGGKVNR